MIDELQLQITPAAGEPKFDAPFRCLFVNWEKSSGTNPKAPQAEDPPHGRDRRDGTLPETVATRRLAANDRAEAPDGRCDLPR